jgi:hypothetical protein
VLRIGDYGLTPPRIAGLAVNALAFAYSFACLAGLFSEARWKSARWMTPVAPLNTAMAALWVASLALIASPLVNLWAISAKSQEMRVATGAAKPDEFDFGYMKFELGPWGERALGRLAAFDGADAPSIRAGAERALNAQTRWEYDNPAEAAAAVASEAAEAAASEDQDAPAAAAVDGQAGGPLDLPFNPEGAPAGDE